MGKDGFLTPKAISNRIKAKGLQKLKFYCQMCNKQCRDANGFKCHKESEGHQRMMLLFAESSDRYVTDFSDKFLQGYLDILRHRFGTKVVKANSVYQEYIKDREHVHMNATKWTTLSEFAKWLGREGLCVVEEKEDGWYLGYVDQDAAERKRKAMEIEEQRLRESEIEERKLQKRIRKAMENAKHDNEGPTELVRDEDSKVGISIKKSTQGPTTKTIPTNFAKLVSGGKMNSSKKTAEANGGGVSALEEIKKMEEKRQQKVARTENWLATGIVVKVLSKEVGSGKFYRRKGEVISVIDKFVAVVRMLEGSQEKLKIDQSELETVIPKPGGEVLILNGAHRNMRAVVEQIDEDKFCCTIRIASGPLRDKKLNDVQYEDISRVVTS